MKTVWYIFAILILFSCSKEKSIRHQNIGMKLTKSEDAVYPLFNFVLFDLSNSQPFITDSITFWGERELSQLEKRKKKTRKKEPIKIYRRKNQSSKEYYMVQLYPKYDKYYIKIAGKEHIVNFDLSRNFYTECCGTKKHIKKAYLNEIPIRRVDKYTFEIDLFLSEGKENEFNEDDLIMAE